MPPLGNLTPKNQAIVISSTIGSTGPTTIGSTLSPSFEQLGLIAPLLQAVTDLGTTVGIEAACDALGIARASFYRYPPVFGPRLRRPIPARALRPEERDRVRSLLNEERFQDCSPAAICATLLDEGSYPCSTRTMYRVLAEAGGARERRDQLTHPEYQKPELLATAPNQLWSWDIIKLRGPPSGPIFIST